MPTPNEKELRTERVVEEALRRCNNGEPIDLSTYARRYPELMPELAERLERFCVAGQALDETPPPPPSDDSTGQPDPELAFLQEALEDCNPIERIDRGGQGVVYKAFEPSTKRLVALKLLLDGPLATDRQKRRFAREIELASRLHHPNIAAIFASGELRGRPYVVMEYVDGCPIDEYVAAEAFSTRETVAVFLTVCQAVSTAHQNGVIHRDLKPSNILVDADAKPHILDFGLAKDLWDDVPERNLSLSGQVIGTLPYLSPEQATGEPDDVDTRADIYSLGVVLYQLVSGRFPYTVTGDRETVLANITSCRPSKPTALLRSKSSPNGASYGRIDNDLEKVILKALEKDPALRYQSAAAFADDLQRYLCGEAVEAKAASGFYQLRKALRKFRVHVGVALAFVLLLVVATFAFAIEWRRAERINRIARTGLEMGSLLKLGGVQRNAGRLDQGIALFENALKLGDTIHTTDSIVQRQRFDAHRYIAETYLETERPNEGEEHCIKAIELARSMLDTDVGESVWQRRLASSITLRGRLEMSRESYPTALDHFDEAVSILHRLIESKRDDASLQESVAQINTLQGKCAQLLSEFEDAQVYYSESHSIRQRLVDDQPDVPTRALDLVRAECALAAFHISKGATEDDRQAAQWLQQAEQHLEQVSNSAGGAVPRWNIEALRRDIEAYKSTIRTREGKSVDQ
ncbi:MAG: serine/threonine protein kinase [Phycisphaerales bacterium]|nr:MAG: serine/threonine protein kinase [Phycisphaerales bacterium]